MYYIQVPMYYWKGFENLTLEKILFPILLSLFFLATANGNSFTTIN